MRWVGLGQGDEDDATEYAGSERSMSRGGSMKSESSVSTILLDTALTSETNDLAAQVTLGASLYMLCETLLYSCFLLSSCCHSVACTLVVKRFVVCALDFLKCSCP